MDVKDRNNLIIQNKNDIDKCAKAILRKYNIRLNLDDLEDLLQDIYLHIIIQIDKGIWSDHGFKFMSYWGVVIERFINNRFFRDSKKYKEDGDIQADYIIDNFDSGTFFDEEVEGKLLLDQVFDHIKNNYDDIDNQIFLLKYKEEKQIKEIVQITGVSQAVVMRKLKKMKEDLSEVFGFKNKENKVNPALSIIKNKGRDYLIDFINNSKNPDKNYKYKESSLNIYIDYLTNPQLSTNELAVKHNTSYSNVQHIIRRINSLFI